MIDRERWPLMRVLSKDAPDASSTTLSVAAWRIVVRVILPAPLLSETGDPRQAAAERLWQAGVAPPCRLDQMVDVDDSLGLVFDGFIPDAAAGPGVDDAVRVAMNALDAVGLEVVGNRPTEIRLTSLPAAPDDLPGYPSWLAALEL